MPTADMHGGTVEFKDRDGREVGFELVRIGTLKEFETAKAALAQREQDLRAAGDENSASLDRLQAMNVKRHDAESAYKAEAETSAERLAELSTVRGDYDQAVALLESTRAKFAKAETDYEDIATHVNHADAEVMRMRNVVKDKDAEISRLVDVKAQVEEFNTALEVSQKELCAEQDVSKRVLEERKLVVAERDASRAALADLKAELLTEGNRFKTILDTLAEKIAGE